MFRPIQNAHFVQTIKRLLKDPMVFHVPVRIVDRESKAETVMKITDVLYDSNGTWLVSPQSIGVIRCRIGEYDIAERPEVSDELMAKFTEWSHKLLIFKQCATRAAHRADLGVRTKVHVDEDGRSYYIDRRCNYTNQVGSDKIYDSHFSLNLNRDREEGEETYRTSPIIHVDTRNGPFDFLDPELWEEEEDPDLKRYPHQFDKRATEVKLEEPPFVLDKVGAEHFESVFDANMSYVVYDSVGVTRMRVGSVRVRDDYVPARMDWNNPHTFNHQKNSDLLVKELAKHLAPGEEIASIHYTNEGFYNEEDEQELYRRWFRNLTNIPTFMILPGLYLTRDDKRVSNLNAIVAIDDGGKTLHAYRVVASIANLPTFVRVYTAEEKERIYQALMERLEFLFPGGKHSVTLREM